MTNPVESNSPGAPGVSRRTLATTALWAAPVVIAVGAAPHVAASMSLSASPGSMVLFSSSEQSYTYTFELTLAKGGAATLVADNFSASANYTGTDNKTETAAGTGFPTSATFSGTSTTTTITFRMTFFGPQDGATVSFGLNYTYGGGSSTAWTTTLSFATSVAGGARLTTSDKSVKESKAASSAAPETTLAEPAPAEPAQPSGAEAANTDTGSAVESVAPSVEPSLEPSPDSQPLG